MEVTHALRSNAGHLHQDDSVLADPALGLYMVCHGIGTPQAAEVASHRTTEVVRQELAQSHELRAKFLATAKPADADSLRKMVENAMLQASKELFKQASQTPSLAGAASTCTVILFIGHNKAVLGHVGDTRLYVVRAKRAHQLTEDHTYVNDLVRRGALNRDQASNHPHANVLSRALGVQPSVSIDTMVFDIDDNDTYLLCSDALYSYFPTPEVIGTHLQQSDVHVGLTALIAAASGQGGNTDAAVLVMRLGAGVSTQTTTPAEQRIALLQRIPIFSHLSYKELVKVLGLTQLTPVAGNTVFINEGDIGDEFYVVLAGEVEVMKGDDVLTTLKPGAHIGEMAMVDNAPRSATVRAKSDVTLLVMRRQDFFNVIRQEPVIATKLLWSFVKVLSGRLRDTNTALEGARRELHSSDFEIFVDT